LERDLQRVAPVWRDVGSPSAEMQCRETKHKSINVAKVLKTKVKGSVNISQHDLWRTQRSARDFKKTGEVTWKAAAERGDSKKGSWYWLSSELFGYPGIKIGRQKSSFNSPDHSDKTTFFFFLRNMLTSRTWLRSICILYWMWWGMWPLRIEVAGRLCGRNGPGSVS